MLQIRREQGFCEFESLAAMRSGVRSPYAPPLKPQVIGSFRWPALFCNFFCTTQIHHILHHKAVFRGSSIFAPRAVEATDRGLSCSPSSVCGSPCGLRSVLFAHASIVKARCKRVWIQIETRSRARSPPRFISHCQQVAPIGCEDQACAVDGVPLPVAQQFVYPATKRIEQPKK